MKITKSKKTVNDDIRLKMERWVARVKKKKVFMFNLMEVKKAKKKQKNTFFASILKKHQSNRRGKGDEKRTL